MPNSIAFAQNYTSVIDEVYQRASVSGVLNSGRRMVRAGHNAKEILIPKISVTGLGDYTRNVSSKPIGRCCTQLDNPPDNHPEWEFGQTPRLAGKRMPRKASRPGTTPVWLTAG